MAKWDPRITEAVSLLKAPKLGAHRPLKTLPRHLGPNEHVQRIALSGDNRQLLAVTEHRILWLTARGSKVATAEIPRPAVTSITWTAGLATGTLEVAGPSETLHLAKVLAPDGEALAHQARTPIT